MASNRFSATARGVVGAGGALTLFLPGPPSWYRYNLSTVVLSSVRADSSSFPTAAVYRSTIAPSSLLGQSRSADAVTFEAGPGDVLFPGDQLIVVFAGALVGSTAVANMFGEQAPL